MSDAAQAAATAAAEAYLDGLATGTPAATQQDAVALGVASGELVDNLGTGSAKGQVLNVLVLKAGTCAVARVEWANSAAGWLTLLIEGDKWVVISAVASDAFAGPFKVLPDDMLAVSRACWDEYGGANRACDGARMAEVFHPKCRLTYTGPDGAVVIKPQEAFCSMVTDRYTLPLHSPYAHLREDPRVSAQDTLLSVTFAAPDLAMVVLKVGHPPMLWTDVLTCARLANGKWWIVAKSSCSEPLLKEEARAA